ncbi:MAG: peptide chain release factor N(5)-glutamine methyltransferase [Clostridia bacterium]|nr:peptide chain release factor N(5)-glutamine methyltransferase [Clostridia bacterium]
MEKIVLPLGCGIGVVDGKKLCVSVVDQGGDKKVNGQVVNINNKLWKYPFLRAFTYFFYCIVFYFKALFLQGELIGEKPPKNKKEKGTRKINFSSSYILAFAILLSVFIVAFLVVGLLPSKIFDFFFEYNFDYYFRSLMIALFRVGILYLLLVILRFIPVMTSFYAFNGAGNAFMSGKSGGIKNINYPLNFLNLILNVFCFSTFVISLIAVNVSWIVNLLVNLVIFLAFIPICYETLRFAGAGRWEWLKNATLIFNWLVTIKPNTTHNEVLLVAKREMNNFDDFLKADGGAVSMSAVYAEMMTKLKSQEGVEESDIDWIIATVLNKNRAEIKLCRFVSGKEYRDIMRACDRRAKGEPLSNIFGFVEFYGLRFDVNKKVLSPRMETEILVEEVIKKARETDARSILDLCTGSGAIAVSLAKYTDCKVFASDISKQALAIAQANAQKNGVKIDFSHSDLTKGLKKSRKYDIIVSNPPYIKSGDIEKLDEEVKKYDPRLALDGGEDGLDFYRRIAQEVPSRLCKKGWLFLEVGKGQAEDVCLLLQENGFDNVQTIKDYNKIERVVYGRISK